MLDFGRDTWHFLRENARWLAGGFLLTLFSSFGQSFFIGLSGDALRATFHLSGGAFGGVYMLATMASAITLPWLGRTLDLMPGWKVVRFTAPALGLACVLIAIAPNVVVLTLALYLLRLFGLGMMLETAFTEIGRWFVANRGRAMALIAPGQQAGVAILPIAVVLIARATGGWRTAWIVSAALIVLAGMPAIIALMKVERVPRSKEAKVRDRHTARDWTRSEVIRDPILYLLLLGVLAPSVISTVIFFEQDYLIDLRGYDRLAFAAAYPVMSVTTVFFGLVCGDLIDRFGSLKLLPYFLLPLAVATAAVGLVNAHVGRISLHVPARHQQRLHVHAARCSVAGGVWTRQSRRHPRRSSSRPWCSRPRSGPAFPALSSIEASRCRNRCSGCPGGVSRRASCWPLPPRGCGCARKDKIAVPVWPHKSKSRSSASDQRARLPPP